LPRQSDANKRKTGKEQYYTTPEVVDICLELVQKHVNLKDRKLLEPCAGTGEFVKGFQRIGVKDDDIVCLDIEPKHPMVTKGNYLETNLDHKSFISITNPPFGRASSLAKKFFNHAAEHSDYICYLIPKAWRKWSTQNALNKSFHLVADIDVPDNCFYLPDGSKKDSSVLKTVFQIWEKRKIQRKKIVIPDNKLIKKIIPKVKNGKKIVVGANFEIIQFGYSCGKTKEITDKQVPFKTTTMYLKIDREDVKKALSEIDYSVHYNNVSYVQSLSLPEINYELNNYFGLNNFKFM
jgi:predicted RNA methylase